MAQRHDVTLVPTMLRAEYVNEELLFRSPCADGTDDDPDTGWDDDVSRERKPRPAR
jgi:hypothetical protein